MKPDSLQETGIDVAHETGLRPRHLHDDIVLEPLQRLGFGKQIDSGWVLACVDGAAHQGHRARRRAVPGFFHDGNGRQHRNGRLTHGHHMGLGTQHPQHFDDIVDVVVEVEPAVGDRHHAGIDPVGDVDIGARQQGFDGAAQERGIVPRHRCDDQNLRTGPFVGGQRALKMNEIAEGFLPDDLLVNRNPFEIDRDLVDVECRFGVAPGRPFEHFEPCGHRPPGGCLRHRIEWVGISQPHRIRRYAPW